MILCHTSFLTQMHAHFRFLIFNRVYIIIRLFIRVAEHLVARPKHRRLRRQMALSKSYPEWYKYAAELDHSQKRDRWLKEMHDGTSKRYNWVFIRELMKDMQRARSTEDPIFALAVLQQCTRKVSLIQKMRVGLTREISNLL
jgi:Domain of unknown function (DUF3336)